MAQDLISDALNQIMNAKRVGKKELSIRRKSKLLLNLFEMMADAGHISFEDREEGVFVKILKLNNCKAVKPRYYVSTGEVEKYLRRYLPSRNFGTLVVSTSKGLMNHEESEANKIGGALIAYFY